MSSLAGIPAPATQDDRRVSQYEFDSKESEVCRGLGSAISFVGIALAAFGILEGISGILDFVYGSHRVLNVVLSLSQAVSMFLIGIWFRGAGRAFGDIARTRGNDMGNLMQALIRLRSAFRLQRALLTILIGILVIALAFAALAIAMQYGVGATTS